MANRLTSAINPSLRRIAALIAASTALFVIAHSYVFAANVSGVRQKWQPINIDFSGPVAKEQDQSPNPFLDLRLTVIFTSPSGRTIEVPGFFAGDGNGNGSGNIWRARFAADEAGTWQYKATLRSGKNVAISTAAGAGAATSLDGDSGSFQIAQQPSNAPGFLKYGRLNYVGGHYLKFADGPYWIKSGTDSPENFLGYAGIDGTVDAGGINKNFLHKYSSHRDQWRSGDPLFSNSKTGEDSLGIIGSLNYLADQGVNSIYFLPMNLGGDGQETYPFLGFQNTSFNKTHYDISKLYQWNTVLSHAQRRGIALNIVLSETERANERWLDDGQLGVERKLYFRELIARFGYLLAAKWNLGEENDYPVSELKKHADYIRALDWSNKPIAVHTQINDFRDYEKLVGHPSFSASSIQYNPSKAGGFVETWRKRSKDAGRAWVIDMDENTGGVTNNNAAQRRKLLLYDVYFSGGNIEWYFGYHPLPLGGDVTAGNFALRSNIWQYTRIAREFMESELPFWRMEPADNLVTGESDSNGGAEVFAAINEVYAVYLPSASNTAIIDLRGANNSFTLRWFNPSNGQFTGASKQIKGGARVSLGNPPSRRNDDWVALLQAPDASTGARPQPQADAPLVVAEPAVEPITTDPVVAIEADTATVNSNSPPQINASGIATATAGEFFRFTINASDSDGAAPVVSAATLPPGMRFESVDNGVATLTWQVPRDAIGTFAFEVVATDTNERSVKTSRIVEVNVQAAPQEQPTAVQLQAEPEVATTAKPVLQQSGNDKPAPLDIVLGDQPPSIFGAKNQTIMVGEHLAQVVYPVDPEGVVASIRAASLPPGATFDDNGNGTRTLRWTPAPEDRGTHEIMFIATDAGSTPFVTQVAMRVEVIDQTVETAPLFQLANDKPIQNFPPILAVMNASIKLGETFIYRIKPIDPEGIAPILHIIVLPEGASFNDNGDGSRTFRWKPSAAGNYQFKIVATDSVDAALTAEMPMSLTVVE